MHREPKIPPRCWVPTLLFLGALVFAFRLAGPGDPQSVAAFSPSTQEGPPWVAEPLSPQPERPPEAAIARSAARPAKVEPQGPAIQQQAASAAGEARAEWQVWSLQRSWMLAERDRISQLCCERLVESQREGWLPATVDCSFATYWPFVGICSSLDPPVELDSLLRQLTADFARFLADDLLPTRLRASMPDYHAVLCWGLVQEQGPSLLELQGRAWLFLGKSPAVDAGLRVACLQWAMGEWVRGVGAQPLPDWLQLGLAGSFALGDGTAVPLQSLEELLSRTRRKGEPWRPLSEFSRRLRSATAFVRFLHRGDPHRQQVLGSLLERLLQRPEDGIAVGAFLCAEMGFQSLAELELVWRNWCANSSG